VIVSAGEVNKVGELVYPDYKQLDAIAQRLQREPGAKLVVIGYSARDEDAESAKKRALDIKTYFTSKKGIDASRIEVRTAVGGHRAVVYLVPPGASFTMSGTTPF
jgi:hypothetical protein